MIDNGEKGSHEGRKTPPVKAHHYSFGWLCMWVLVIGWLFFHWHAEDAKKAELAAARAEAIADTKTAGQIALDASQQYQNALDNEGFIRRHFWSDTEEVKVDRSKLNAANSRWMQMQMNLCQSNGMPDCEIATIKDGHVFLLQNAHSSNNNTFGHRAAVTGVVTAGMGIGGYIVWVIIGIGGIGAAMSGFGVVVLIIIILYALVRYLF